MVVGAVPIPVDSSPRRFNGELQETHGQSCLAEPVQGIAVNHYLKRQELTAVFRRLLGSDVSLCPLSRGVEQYLPSPGCQAARIRCNGL